MNRRVRPPRTLQAKALQLLAQREQSRVELRRKLTAHARSADKAEAEQARLLATDRDCQIVPGGQSGPGVDLQDLGDSASVEARVDTVMAWLEAHHFSSDERFAEVRVNARQGRFGNLRIRQELATHSIELSSEAAQKLVASELERAIDVCEHKFAAAPTDRAEAARQGRFLIARGFSADTVRQVLRRRATRLRAEGHTTAHRGFDDT